MRSLNLPAVQVLEAYGPKRFAASYAVLDCRYILPNGAAPNLSLILGGAGAKLEDMARRIHAFARHGKAGRCAYSLTIGLWRPLMSSGGVDHSPDYG